MADVADRACAKDCVANGVKEHVGIRVPFESKLEWIRRRRVSACDPEPTGGRRNQSRCEWSSGRVRPSR